MFETELADVSGDRQALADLAASIETDLRIAGCRKLQVAAVWADAHSCVDHPDGGLLVEQLVSMGPAGTPPVAETAPAGLVPPFHTSTRGARGWISDALTVRHRLPRLWERVVAGEVYAWQARQLATLTTDLSVATVGQVDEQLTPWITQLSWPGVLTALEAAIADTDQAAYQRREQLAAAKREVRATASEHGLRTLIARGEAGDVTMMMALHSRVAECLAEEGDEDPLPVRMSKAMGWIANPFRCGDLLARHADDPDPHTEPWEKTAAHVGDDTDPWADDLPPAGWETAKHGNYHQPAFDDTDWWDTPRPDQPADNQEYVTWPTDPPIDDQDLTWWASQHDDHHRPGGPDVSDRCDDDAGGDTDLTGHAGSDEDSGDAAAAGKQTGPSLHDQAASTDTAAEISAGQQATDRHADTDDHEPGQPHPDRDASNQTPDTDRAHPCTCGAGTRDLDSKITKRWPAALRPPGWQPLTPAQLAAAAPTVVMHVHLTDQTLADNHGIVRTDAGPILLEQLKRYLIQHDATIKIYPVINPAATASADSYEIPLRLRRAMAIHHPRSVFPHSATASRLDLDHMPAYVKDGPPGQTAMNTLGPLARNEHRAVTVGNWQRRQPEPGVYLWRSPEHWIMITTNQGTLCLGHTEWAHRLWDASEPDVSDTTAP